MTSRDPNRSLSGGWSASGNLHAGNLTEEVSLQANFPFAEDYTLEFNLIPIKAPVGVFYPPVRAEAFITWSVEGNAVTRRVNVGNGVSVTGTGQACRVVIRDTTDLTAGPPFVLGQEYRVSVQVAPGTRAAIQQPPTLYPFPNGFGGLIIVPPLGFVTIPIPNDAGVISASVTVVNATGAPIPDGQAEVTHSVAPGITLKSYDPRFGVWISIAPGATEIILSNNNAVDPFSFQVTFGIDG